MFSMSWEGRLLLVFAFQQYTNSGGSKYLGEITSADPRIRSQCDQTVLMFGAQAEPLYRSVFHGSKLPDKPTMKDFPSLFNYPDYIDAYRFVTEEYVVKDFARVPDLVRLAHILKSYDLRSIEGVANLCKRQGKYTIPYLAGALENEVGAKVIEGVRLEDRLSRKVMETSTPPLPSYRPSEVRDRMNDIAHERKIDDVLGGRNTK